MTIVRWVLLSFVLLVAADVVTLASLFTYRSFAQKCGVATDMKREVHEVYPLLEK